MRALLAPSDTKGIERSTNHVVADTGEVPDSPTTHKDNIVLLQVMPDTRNVSCDLLAIGKTNSRHLAKGGIRLLGSHRFHLETDSPLLGAVIQHRRLTLALGLLTALANKLVNGRHSVFPVGFGY